MKKIFRSFLLSLGFVAMAIQFVSAQNGFSYQAIVRNANGEFLSGKDVTMRITLSCAGKDYYQESHSVTTGSNGELSLTVGKGAILSGSFASVPWNTMNVTMKTEICVNGTDFIKLAEKTINPAPYAFYAASTQPTTTIEAATDAAEDEALFSVKDENGNLIFAVYPNLVKVFIDDTASSAKAMARGFAVSGRKTTKDDNDAIFSVNATGTHVYIDDDSSKAMARGFAVSGKKATKGDDADLFVVDGSGTQVFIDDDESKAMARGFAVSGKKATKDETALDYMTINAEGTHVYIDNDSSKAMARGFAVSGKKATKDGAGENLFVVNDAGTTVYIDDESKAMARGFAVSGKKATKDGADIDYFTVNNDGTQVFVGSEDKAMARGFAVSGRKATKDDVDDNLFVVDNESGTHIYIDDDDTDKAMARGFAVSGRKATKDDDFMSITSEKTLFNINSKTNKPAFAIMGNMSDEPLVAIGNNSFNIDKPVNAAGNTEYIETVTKYNLDVKSICSNVKDFEYPGFSMDAWLKAKGLDPKGLDPKSSFMIDNNYVSVVVSDSIVLKDGKDNIRYVKLDDEFQIFTENDFKEIAIGPYDNSFTNTIDSIICFRFDESRAKLWTRWYWGKDLQRYGTFDCNLNFKLNEENVSHNSKIVNLHYTFTNLGSLWAKDDSLKNYLQSILSGDYSTSAGSIAASWETNYFEEGSPVYVYVHYYYDAESGTEYFYISPNESSELPQCHRFKVVYKGEASYYEIKIERDTNDTSKIDTTYCRHNGNQLHTNDSKFLTAKSMLDRVAKNSTANNKELTLYTEFVVDSAKNLYSLSFDDFCQNHYDINSHYSCLYDSNNCVLRSLDQYNIDVKLDFNPQYNAEKPDWLNFVIDKLYEKEENLSIRLNQCDSLIWGIY